MKLTIPNMSLVVLIGPSGSGKSTFARRHFKPSEVLSSDFFRGLVADDENDQSATTPAFEALQFVAGKRLAAGRMAVVDATNVQEEARRPLVALAREHDVLAVAIVLDLPERLCQDRNAGRSDRSFGPHVIRMQRRQLRQSLKRLGREGFRHVFVLSSPDEVEVAEVERQPLWNDRRHDRGPFDIIGDVHGCYDELAALLALLGYERGGPVEFRHPGGRRAVFVGDLVDRGPRILDTLALVQTMVAAGDALCVPGNHDIKLMRKLRGKDVQITHGLAQSLAEIDALPEAMRAMRSREIADFIDSLVSHYVLDEGRLVVAHAGLKQAYQGRASRRVREFALYGETTGETDEFGLPVRHNWAGEYRGSAYVVYGHTPTPEADWLNRTINIDTGCVFGGKLTALRYPEMELVSVPALATYAVASKPFLVVGGGSEFTAQQRHDDVLDIDDVIGKRIVSTRLMQNITVREQHAAAALEVMSRFAANPKWLIYLPPTMSPCETSPLPGFLEHPAEAFDYYKNHGVGRVICQEKHMGSRAVVVVCRDVEAARKRFGVAEDEAGIVYTRTGRRFFDEPATEREVLRRLSAALDGAGFWDEFASDWFCFDCELMPWSAKAVELLKSQYAAVGAAAEAALAEAVTVLDRTLAQGENAEIRALAERYAGRKAAARQFVAAYRRYCWPVETVDDLRLAPFHLLASEGRVHIDRGHAWHMQTLSKLAAADRSKGPMLLATSHRTVDVTDAGDCAAAIAWWEAHTAGGGEGMVVKPLEWVVRGKRGLVQPAIKCRGPEYLRIIYGPEYQAAENLDRLKSRRLAGKRSLAVREFALGIEALERFVRREPLRRVHECVFGVLALESEPIDPRL
jgi:protein phosphatase